MPQSLVKNLVHLVYSTKGRRPWLPEDIHNRLFAYKAGILKQLDCPAVVIGGVEDHVHMLVTLSKNIALSEVVKQVKKGSSKWMKSAEATGNQDFCWQNGYAGFSVSESKLEQVRQYIENQAEHHRRISFQDELRALFQRHRIEFDERYVWD